MRDDGAIERNLVVKQAAFFRAAAKRGFSAAVLAEETDIPATTLASYVDKPSRKASLMPLAVFVKLARVPEMPAELLSILIEDSGHDVVPHDPARACWLELGEKASSFAAKVFRYQATGGHIDHREDADLREDMRELVAEGQGAILG